jgi:hypothetical protein
MIEWLTQDAFIQVLHSKFSSQQIVLEEYMQFDTSLDINDHLPVTSVITPEAFEEPGPFFRWFCISDNIPFFITSYQPSGKNLLTINTANQLLIKYQYRWTFLTKLNDLSISIIRQIIWLRGYEEEAIISVFLKSLDGVTYEVYRSTSYDEANSLIDFLRTINSDFNYYIGKPDDLNLDWIIIQKQEANPEQIVGRYTRRASAEYAAKVMSEKNDALYYVMPEIEGSLPHSIFFKGTLSENLFDNIRH